MYERVSVVGVRRVAAPSRDRRGRPVQRRLAVGRADDPAEREADSVASEVLARLRTGDRGALDGTARDSRIRRASSVEAGAADVAAAGADRPLDAVAGGSASGSGDVLRRMEPAFGADFGKVRIHTGADVDVAADGLAARAFTVGRDVYIRRSEYRPGTRGGDELIAHELTHTLQQGSSKIRRCAVDGVDVRERVDGSHVSLKRVRKHLDFVRMKRHETNIMRGAAAKVLKTVGAEDLAQRVKPDEGAAGHYWVEIGDLGPDGTTWAPTMSYGWWPAQDTGILKTLAITKPSPGVLNNGGLRDPHHGERAKTQFHPVMEIDDEQDYDLIRGKVERMIGAFAFNFEGTWNWRFGWGKNCHTFQKRMQDQLGMRHDESVAEWLRAPELTGRAAFEKRWGDLKGQGNYIHRYGGIEADPHPTVQEMVDLTPDERQEILEFTGCSVDDMNEWCRSMVGYKGADLFP